MAKTPVRRPPMGWNSWDCFGTTVTAVSYTHLTLPTKA